MSRINISRFRLLAFIAATSLAAPLAIATELVVELTASEIYSNNISLQPSGFEKSDLVTRISPSIDLFYESKLLTADVAYVYETLIYGRNSSFNQDFHQLESRALVKVIGDELTLLGDANYSQFNSDPTAPQVDTNIAATGTRADGYFLSGGPRWRRELPLNTIVDARYVYGIVRYDRADITDPNAQQATNLADVDTQQFTASLQSNRAGSSSLNYEAEYNLWIYDYESTGEVKDQNVYLLLSQELRAGFELFALAGLDSDFSDRQDTSLSEARWEAGFDLSNREGQLRASYGKRYFGSVFRAIASRELADWSFSASYDEEPGTTESLLLQQGIVEISADDIDVFDPTDPGLNRPGDDERFIRKNAGVNAQWSASKTTAKLTGWWDKRERLDVVAGGGGNFLGDDESLGIGFSYDWEAGTKTTLLMSSSWVRRKLFEDSGTGGSGTRDINTWRVDTGLEYKLGRKTSVGANVGYSRSNGTDISDDYSELQASIILVREIFKK